MGSISKQGAKIVGSIDPVYLKNIVSMRVYETDDNGDEFENHYFRFGFEHNYQWANKDFTITNDTENYELEKIYKKLNYGLH